MKTRALTLTLTTLLLGAAGIASANAPVQNPDRKEGDKSQKWSSRPTSPALQAPVAAVARDPGQENGAKVHDWSHGFSSPTLGTVVVAPAAHDHGHTPLSNRNSHALKAPEIDPSTLIVALTLLSGTFLVLRGRRSASNPEG